MLLAFEHITDDSKAFSVGADIGGQSSFKSSNLTFIMVAYINNDALWGVH